MMSENSDNVKRDDKNRKKTDPIVDIFLNQVNNSVLNKHS